MDKIFITRNWHVDAVKLLENHFEVIVWNNSNSPTEDDIIKYSKGCFGVFSEFDDIITKNIIDSSDQLKIISNRAVGYENIDINTAKLNKIRVGNTPGVLVETCADFTMGLLLDLARNITYSNRAVLKGNWKSFNQTPYLGTDVYKKKLAIIGLGQIATAFSRRAIHGFQMDVSYWSRNRKINLDNELGLQYIDNINDLISSCDYLSIHCSLTPETYRIIDKEQFMLMKNVKLINTSRGPTINQDELLIALNNGNVESAALDVTDPEPPDYNSELVNHPKILITPHLGSGSRETFNKMALMAAQNIINVHKNHEMVSEVIID
jgi:glyoxylate reductase